MHTCHVYLVNPADSKVRVYRHNPEDWYIGQHNISWDTDAVELENIDTVDVHLFSLIVRVVYSFNCFQFVTGCHYHFKIFLNFHCQCSQEEVDGRLSWTSKLLTEGVQRSVGWAQLSLETQGYVHAIRVTSAAVQADQ